MVEVQQGIDFVLGFGNRRNCLVHLIIIGCLIGVDKVDNKIVGERYTTASDR